MAGGFRLLPMNYCTQLEKETPAHFYFNRACIIHLCLYHVRSTMFGIFDRLDLRLLETLIPTTWAPFSWLRRHR
jgi:hypothetical protein